MFGPNIVVIFCTTDTVIQIHQNKSIYSIPQNSATKYTTERGAIHKNYRREIKVLGRRGLCNLICTHSTLHSKLNIM